MVARLYGIRVGLAQSDGFLRLTLQVDALKVFDIGESKHLIADLKYQYIRPEGRTLRYAGLRQAIFAVAFYVHG